MAGQQPKCHFTALDLNVCNTRVDLMYNIHYDSKFFHILWNYMKTVRSQFAFSDLLKEFLAPRLVSGGLAKHRKAT